jgi:hypothetical protein
MSAVEMTSYTPLIDALKEKLPERIDDRERLREMVAFAESYGIIVSEHRRKLLVDVEHRTAIALKQLKEGWAYNDEGELVQTEEAATSFSKLNADEKKIMLAAEVSGINAELEFVTNLENLIKRRTSLGQSMLNSMNIETQSSFNN